MTASRLKELIHERRRKRRRRRAILGGLTVLLLALLFIRSCDPDPLELSLPNSAPRPGVKIVDLGKPSRMERMALVIGDQNLEDLSSFRQEIARRWSSEHTCLPANELGKIKWEFRLNLASGEISDQNFTWLGRNAKLSETSAACLTRLFATPRYQTIASAKGSRAKENRKFWLVLN